jgi:hypothetical protein
MGIIHRQLNDLEEARLVHALVLRTAAEGHDLFSRMISNADLGYIALSGKQTAEALKHLRRALQSAKQLTDDENEARIHMLLGQAWEQQHDWAGAQSEYWIANESALAANHVALAKIAQQKEQKMTIRLVVNRLLDGFYVKWLQPRLSFTSDGEKVLVVNTCQEISIRIVAEPRVDREGNLTLSVTLTSTALKRLPEEFFLDLIFLPTLEVLQAIRVGSTERQRLLAARGLELKALLPNIDGFLEHLDTVLEQKQYRGFPRTALAFRIWWKV